MPDGRRIDTIASMSECPSEQVLSGFADQTLDADEQATIEEHLADCRACRVVLAAAAGEEEVPDPPMFVRESVGRYQIEDECGRGGQSIVWRARDLHLQRP